MEINDLVRRFSRTTGDRQKAIFSTLFIAGNQLQTIFDSRIPALSLKQFMLLSVARQAGEPPEFFVPACPAKPGGICSQWFQQLP